MIVKLLQAGSLIAIGLIVGYLGRLFFALRKKESVERKIRDLIEQAKTEAKEIVLKAKEKASSLIDEARKEERQRKQEISKLEERLIKQQEELEKKVSSLEQEKIRIENIKKSLFQRQEEIKKLKYNAIEQLQKISQLSSQQAKELLLKEIEKQNHQELADILAKFERRKDELIRKKALEALASVVQRYARNYIGELTTTVIDLPNEEMKGKIIGKEGRNIRTIERLTGVDVIIDETPKVVTLSSFDPLRREIAKLALEKLIKDQRIQPARIEEKVEEAKAEIEQRIKEIGEAACYEVGIVDLPQEIVYLMGKLNFRTSYGQNVLRHSVETALLAGALAGELGANVKVAKKAGFLHDIGKAVTEEVKGSHVEVGRKILQKYNIEEEVIRAMESHHEDYPFASPEAYIVATADTLSTARPGARRDTLENYLKRLEQLEKIATQFEGVKNAYAISGGRELRIFVIPEKVDDFEALKLARDIANKIQSELSYPGEIKVNVIREIRAVEYAR